MSQPIDVYFDRLQKCQKISEDAGYKITEPEMVLQLQTSLGATGLMNEEYKAWKKKPVTDRTWKKAKRHFRTALADATGIQKLTTAGSGLMANSALKQTRTPAPKAIEDKVRLEIAQQLGESFDNLALAATMKSDTIDSLTRSVADLTATNTKLTNELTILRASLDRALKALNENKNDGGGGGGARGQQRTPKNEGTKTWPAWCDPDAYCFTCGYKLRKGHNSKTCKFAANPNHKKEATRQNTMGGSKLNAGFGNAPNGM